MPSVLLVTQDLARAGAQRQCVELALGLAERPGWRVEVATLETGGPLAADLKAAGVPLHICARTWRWDLSPARAVSRLVRARQLDILHSFLFLPNFYGRCVRLFQRSPVIISSLRSTGIQGAPRYALEVLMAPLCDLIIANSHAGMRDLAARGVSPARMLVIRNGLDLSRFAAIERPQAAVTGKSVIGMVAQMEPRKDHRLLVTAFALVLRQRPEARLVLAGDGRLRPDIETHVRRAGVSASVEMPGTVAGAEDVYRRLAIYVQASASEEGTSNSIVEAMASGLPVIATDIGGNAETVRHNETGLIVPPRDPEALAAAILSLLEGQERRHAMGMLARAVALTSYSRAGMVEATIAAYEAALAKARSAGNHH